MNQGKLEVVKQEMARVNINILGISTLKWTGMGELNSNDGYIYHCGQESLRRNGVAIIVNKSPKCSTWIQSQKSQNDLCSFPSQIIQYHSNPNLQKSITSIIQTESDPRIPIYTLSCISASYRFVNLATLRRSTLLQGSLFPLSQHI